MSKRISESRNKMLLKEDGSLDIERISKLPLEEHLNVVSNLTSKQLKEYLSKKPIKEANRSRQVCYTDKPMEEWGVDAMDFLNKKIESLK